MNCTEVHTAQCLHHSPLQCVVWCHLGKTSREIERLLFLTICAYDRIFFDDDNDGCSDNYDDNGGKIDDNDECYPHTLLVSSGKISKFMPRQVGFISS